MPFLICSILPRTLYFFKITTGKTALAQLRTTKISRIRHLIRLLDMRSFPRRLQSPFIDSYFPEGFGSERLVEPHVEYSELLRTFNALYDRFRELSEFMPQ
jgi:hypothetical protein